MRPRLTPRYFFSAFLLLAVWGLLLTGVGDPRELFILSTALLLGVIAFEVAAFLRESDQTLRWAAPPVLASVLGFGTWYGLSNVAFFDPRYASRYLELSGGTYHHAAQMVLLAGLGTLSMWLGYRSRAAWRLGRILADSRFLAVLTRSNYEFAPVMVWVFVATGVVSRLALLSFDAFGYGTGAGDISAIAGIHQFLRLGQLAGMAALIAVALTVFGGSRISRPSGYLTLLALVALEVFWGLVSGMKAAVVAPVLILVIAAMVTRGRVPKSLLVIGIALLLLAYVLIEPYRSLSVGRSDLSTVGARVEALGRVAPTADFLPSVAAGSYRAVLPQVMARQNFTGPSAVAAHMAVTRPRLVEGRDLAMTTLLSPLHAVVPRALWPSKPTADLGRWFYLHGIRGTSEGTSVGMGVVGFLFLAGGALGVALGLGLVGVLQRSVVEGFAHQGGGGAFVLIVLIIPLVSLNSYFPAIIADVIRYLPIALVVQLLLFRRSEMTSSGRGIGVKFGRVADAPA